jgi:site-specific DNA-methyltransferase (adenine-specific)
MKVTDKLTITNEDNMKLMARYPDNYFDLAIVDPPYGIDVTKMTLGNGKKKINRGTSDWDSKTPPPEYFEELRRVSKNQVIWGANYMTENLPPSMGWVYWDKGTGANDFSDGELAYTSFNRALRCYKVGWVGANAKDTDGRYHPTQKPVKLYEWLLMNYAKQPECDNEHCEDGWIDEPYKEKSRCHVCRDIEPIKILDTHLGSGSIALACHNLGFELTACELDKEYYEASIKRIENHISQIRMF